MEKIKTIMIVCLSVALIVVIATHFVTPRYLNEKKMLDEYGVSQRTAYEKVISYCEDDDTLSKSVCDSLLMHSVIPYVEEYGSGYQFIFSNTRRVTNDSVVLSVDVRSDGSTPRVQRENSLILDNFNQTLRP